VEGEAYIKRAVDARKCVQKAANDWRDAGGAKTAAQALLTEQHRFRDALAALGAKSAPKWAIAVPLFADLPFDETSRRDPVKARRWICEELQKWSKGAASWTVTGLVAEARGRFHLGKHAARDAYQFATGKTGITLPTEGGRPRKSAS
jgi:hypothetical protein